MDKIFLRELEVEAVIGIWEWERRITQKVSIDLEMATDARAASSADDIEGTLNYRDVAKRLIEFVGESQFELVESLAEAIARAIVEEFHVPWTKVSVAKPGAIQGSRTVGITIERTPEDYT
ncbi:MAG: dihydroneopterin aldolase [Gammaproteobacteria bacterium]|nr:dihydroneopterin aldolase [Gammaproteobacteria bacterium]